MTNMLNSGMLAAGNIIPPEERINIEEKNAAMARQLRIAIQCMKECQEQCRRGVEHSEEDIYDHDEAYNFSEDFDEIGKKLAEALHLMGAI